MVKLTCPECGKEHGHPEKWQHALHPDGTYECTGRPARDIVVPVEVGEGEQVVVDNSGRTARRWRSREEYNAYMKKYMAEYRRRGK